MFSPAKTNEWTTPNFPLGMNKDRQTVSKYLSIHPNGWKLFSIPGRPDEVMLTLPLSLGIHKAKILPWKISHLFKWSQ